MVKGGKYKKIEKNNFIIIRKYSGMNFFKEENF